MTRRSSSRHRLTRCIEQAQIWTKTSFIGVDISNHQTDLQLLAEIQRDFGGPRPTDGSPYVDWADLASRIRWITGDVSVLLLELAWPPMSRPLISRFLSWSRSLQTLPFDSGAFDLVHLRGCNVFISENAWADVLQEAIRVLRKGTGVLEVSPFLTPRSRLGPADSEVTRWWRCRVPSRGSPMTWTTRLLEPPLDRGPRSLSSERILRPLPSDQGRQRVKSGPTERTSASTRSSPSPARSSSPRPSRRTTEG